MKNYKLLLFLSAFSSIFFNAFLTYGQTVDIQVKVGGIKSPKGKIVLTVFKDRQSFEKRQAIKNMVFDKKALVGESLILTFKMEHGSYGITLLDDENGNGKMDNNFIGMPKEGFGFSNFSMKFMRKPAFDDFKVNLTSTQNKVDIKVKYL